MFQNLKPSAQRRQEAERQRHHRCHHDPHPQRAIFGSRARGTRRTPPFALPFVPPHSPLPSHPCDLDLFIAYFTRAFAGRAGKRIAGLSAPAMRLLHRYPFPGNVRELRNVLERAVTFAREETVDVADLPDRVRRAGAANGSGRAVPGGPDGPPGAVPGEAALPLDLLRPADDVLPTLEEVEMRYIRHVLDWVEGNKRRAAALLGISRRTLYRRLEKEGPQ